MSIPRLNALYTTAKNVNSTSAIANDPIVNVKRTFFRNRFANINLQNFISLLPQELLAQSSRLPPARPFRGAVSFARAPPQPDRASPSTPFCGTSPPIQG